MGVTPHQYLAAQRIERAKQLLRSTSLTPSEVALSTGFADQSHFTKVFRRIAGTTPGRFRAERVG
jgi:transcriptional regulator GlxA family with amidase domain